MLYSEFTKKLALNQLKNMPAVVPDHSGDIKPEFQEMILSLTNDGLTDIHTRKKILTKEIDLEFEDGVTIYPLIEGASYLNATLTEPFVDDSLILVTRIIDQYGNPHSHDSNGHITTPDYKTLKFSASKITELSPKIRIEYQATHPKITEVDSINLPLSMYTNLQLFVASLYISHINGEEHTSKGDSYYAAYLRGMGNDTTQNTSSVSELFEDTRLTDRGFV